MDSGKLAAMLESIQNNGLNIRSVVVIRNGYIVTEAYFHPFRKDTWHIIHSCTKSITSALVGIAIDEGYIEGVEEGVLDFFPDKTFENVDKKKKTMTLEHLLTMSSGLCVEDSYRYDFRGLGRMMAASDWVEHVLSLPLLHEPGTYFEYSNGVSYVLSEILQRKTGMTLMRFAEDRLFGPLGISDVDWFMNDLGVNLGWGGIRMKPLDLAKITLLYLNKGQWDGKKIISREWIESSTTAQIAAQTLSEGYGYQWWIDSGNYQMMLGYSGQYAVVVPDKNMVVVINSALHSNNFFAPERYLFEYIIRAAKSPDTLPYNPEGFEHLESVIHTIAEPERKLVPQLPGMAFEISGKFWIFDTNPIQFRRISIAFDPQSDEAQFSLESGPSNFHGSIGLDSAYRLTKAEGFLRAYRGFWESDSTFVIDYQIVDHTERGEARLTFEGEKLTVSVYGAISGVRHDLTAELEK